MADWVLVPSLVQLRNEFNRIAPSRGKESDGSVGDAAHAGTSSDHNPDETGHVPIRDADSRNEVHAIDVDKDLRVPGLDMERVVRFLLVRCRAGQERRLRYIIWNRHIWSASNGWAQRNYTGPNPHDQHAHFSASYDSNHEASTASWRLEDIPMPLNNDDKQWIAETIRNEVRATLALTDFGLGGGQGSQAGNAVLGHGYPQRPGEDRQAAWRNLQALQLDLDALQDQVQQINAKLDF